MASPELQTILGLLKSQPISGGDEEPSVEEVRAAFDGLAAIFPPASDVCSQAVDAGGVSADWIEVPGAVSTRARRWRRRCTPISPGFRPC